MASVLRAWVVGGLMAAVACGATTPLPDVGPHGRGEERVVVDRPPADPVQVESVGVRPHEAAVWVDGYWHWTGRRWEWRSGVWAVPPPGAYYAPPSLIRITQGEGMAFSYVPGHWHLADGGVGPVEPYEPADSSTPP